MFVDSSAWGFGGGWSVIREKEVVYREMMFSTDFEFRKVAGAASKEVEHLNDGSVGAVFNWEDGVVWRGLGFAGGGLES